MTIKRATLVLALISAFSAFAGDVPWSITPNKGPTTGGTTVTIKGPFGSWPYGAIFGGIPAPSTSRIDEDTIVAVTPPHLPGTVEVVMFEYDIGLSTPLTFTYEGPVPVESYARVLLPVYIPPTPGAHGAEFRTDLSLTAKPGREATLYGLVQNCVVLCIEPPGYPITVYAGRPSYELNLEPNGTPGRFFYVEQNQVRNLSAHLRAYDVSREATNYGTELPVVRFDTESDPVITLASVPTDPRFRNTLRIYSDVPMRVHITAGDVQETLQLQGANDIYTPASGVWTNFPSGVGPVTVTVTAEPVMADPPAHAGKIWAFATVTNNDTQAITTVTPQP